MLHLDDAARFFRTEGPTGVQLRLARRAPGPRVWPPSWPPPAGRPGGARLDAHQPHLVRCGAGRKRMMFIILTLIVAVAAFNLVSARW
jgi:lipoprotein-releasing system permease protein